MNPICGSGVVLGPFLGGCEEVVGLVVLEVETGFGLAVLLLLDEAAAELLGGVAVDFV